VTHRWYAVQTTSGHENKVRNLVQRKIDADPAVAESRPIRQALVPTEQVVEIKTEGWVRRGLARCLGGWLGLPARVDLADCLGVRPRSHAGSCWKA
jgi:transcription antitermination factor NusG